MNLQTKSATELSKMLRNKEVLATEIAQSCFAQMAKVEPQVGAMISTLEETALQEAKQVDAAIAKGEAIGALAGIPIAVKDNICIRGTKTTCASKMLENFVAPYTATVIENVKAAGGIVTGKANMDEFAMGSTCANSALQTTRNPWDFSCTPGGSSGGSAAAVAALEAPLALGSDTGGSVRGPASYCGVVGLKPTYGALSRYGVVAMASSLDQVGVFSRTVDDAALLFSAMTGKDSMRDATSKDFSLGTLGSNVKGLRIGIPKEYYGSGVTDEVRAAVLQAIETYRAMGAIVADVSLPSTGYALAAYYIISSAEASSNLARFDGIRYGYSAGREEGLNQLYLRSRSEGFGAEVKRRIMLGTYVLSSGFYDAYYKRAKMLQAQIRAEFAQAFASCDVLLTPTTPHTAPKIGAHANDAVAEYAADICTVTVNIAGLPAVSVPCGLDSASMPIGMQLIGAKWSENTLLTAARCYEQSVGGFARKEL